MPMLFYGSCVPKLFQSISYQNAPSPNTNIKGRAKALPFLFTGFIGMEQYNRIYLLHKLPALDLVQQLNNERLVFVFAHVVTFLLLLPCPLLLHDQDGVDSLQGVFIITLFDEP